MTLRRNLVGIATGHWEGTRGKSECRAHHILCHTCVLLWLSNTEAGSFPGGSATPVHTNGPPSPSSIPSPCRDHHTIRPAVSPGVPLRLLGRRDARDGVAVHARAADAEALDTLVERVAYLIPVVELERAQLPQELVGHLRKATITRAHWSHACARDTTWPVSRRPRGWSRARIGE